MSGQHGQSQHLTFETDELSLVGGIGRDGEWHTYTLDQIRAGEAAEFLAFRAERIAAEKSAGKFPFVTLDPETGKALS